MNAVCGAAEANGINVCHGSISVLGSNAEIRHWRPGRKAVALKPAKGG